MTAGFHLETERLVLRDWLDQDWQPFWNCTNTPAVMRWLGGVCDDARAAAQERLLGYQRDHGHTFWVVERREDGALLGFCGLKRSNQPGGPLGLLEIGWRLREEAWGQGYAREAAQATLDYAFRHLPDDAVVAFTVAGNEGSWGLMQRLGMQRREDLDFDSPDFDPVNPRIIAYAIDRAIWSAAHG